MTIGESFPRTNGVFRGSGQRMQFLDSRGHSPIYGFTNKPRLRANVPIVESFMAESGPLA